METFPYYDNYEELTRLELCAIHSAGLARPRKIAFVGSGPLPLTPICLLKALKQDALSSTAPPKDNCQGPVIINVDRDEKAVATATNLINKLGISPDEMEHRCDSADSEVQNLSSCDVVYLAALVGVTQLEKEQIALSIAARMRPGALLVIRSSWGLRRCLYPVSQAKCSKDVPMRELMSANDDDLISRSSMRPPPAYVTSEKSHSWFIRTAKWLTRLL